MNTPCTSRRHGAMSALATTSAVAVLLCLLCQSATRADAPADAAVLVKDVPHVKQKPDFCGEACVEMVLRKLGSTATQDDVFNASELDPALGRGCYTADLAKAMQKIGFDPGKVWFPFDAADAAKETAAQWEALRADLAKGVPSIVCTHFDESPDTTEHFRLVLGYDPKTDEVIYNDPALDKGGRLRMTRSRLLKLWPLRSSGARQQLIRLRCEPGTIATIAAASGFTPADYAQHVMALKSRIAGKGFAIVIEPPFVVVGDESPETVRRHAARTVKWAVEKLKRDYFKNDPAAIMDVWLFKDEASYEKHTLELFQEKPTTPFGFCSDTHNALIMNIKTGGGTLVHEIVHPYMRANFPDCPAWLNEGLGSLYEQSSERDGHIVGLTNWRLAGLQREIAADSLPTFPELLGTTNHAFYASEHGNNYAQARYLCYYLQEKGLLTKFYHEFVKSHDKDASGLATLKQVLGEEDMATFKTKWEAFVVKITFP